MTNRVADCPKCQKGMLQSGYGLAGGGIGAYTYCDNCDFFEKTQDPEAKATGKPDTSKDHMFDDDEDLW